MSFENVRDWNEVQSKQKHPHLEIFTTLYSNEKKEEITRGLTEVES